jgi:hypothetical protein
MRFEVYETSEGRVPYLDWFDGLDGTPRRAVQRRLRAIEDNESFVRSFASTSQKLTVRSCCSWEVPVSGTKTVKLRRHEQD